LVFDSPVFAPVLWVKLMMYRAPQGVHALRSVKRAFDDLGKVLLVAGVRQKVQKTLDNSNLTSEIG
jgi:hypothetical protein